MIKVRYFDESGKEIFPKYKYFPDVYYLDIKGRKPVIYHLKDNWLQDIKPGTNELVGNDEFLYTVRIQNDWFARDIEVPESQLYPTT